jgi:hypothetical protein
MRRWIGAAAVVGALVASPAAAEASSIGITVTGSFEFDFSAGNYFDPANNQVPAGFGNSSPGTNTVVVAEPLTEFGFFAEDNSLGHAEFSSTANFTDQQLIVTYSAVGDIDRLAGWTMTFTSPSFQGWTVSEVSDTLGVSGSLVGATLTLRWDPVYNPQALPTAVFDLGPAAAPVPEPTSLCLLGSGLIALVRYRGRRPR